MPHRPYSDVEGHLPATLNWSGLEEIECKISSLLPQPPLILFYLNKPSKYGWGHSLSLTLVEGCRHGWTSEELETIAKSSQQWYAVTLVCRDRGINEGTKEELALRQMSRDICDGFLHLVWRWGFWLFTRCEWWWGSIFIWSLIILRTLNW